MSELETSRNPEAYKLPICDTNKERRNFKGYHGTKSYVNLGDLQQGWQSGNTGNTGPGKVQTDRGPKD